MPTLQATTPVDRAVTFWDRTAARYARRPVPDEAVYQEKLRITRDYLRPDMDVLEIGCGTGSTAISHAPYVRHVDAVDFSAEMIAIARQRAKVAGAANVAFRQAALDDLEPSAVRYDAVLALSLLHLVPDRDAAIARIRALLAPGGVFVSSTACIGERMGWMKAVAPVALRLGLFPPLRIFKADDLRRSLTAAGFAIEHDWQVGKGDTLFVVARRP